MERREVKLNPDLRSGPCGHNLAVCRNMVGATKRGVCALQHVLASRWLKLLNVRGNGKPQKAISGPVGGFSIKMQHYVTKGVAIERHNPRKISAEAH